MPPEALDTWVMSGEEEEEDEEGRGGGTKRRAAQAEGRTLTDIDASWLLSRRSQNLREHITEHAY
jgi:hypothetical protein